MTSVILAGGDIRVSDRLKRLAASADLVIAANSGLEHASSLSVVPHLLVGDFDSVSPVVLSAYPDLPRERHPQDKDRLDLELALDAAIARGASDLSVIGSLGGRLDQTLASVFIAARYKRRGLSIALHSGHHDVHLVAAGEAFSADEDAPGRFSVLSLEPTSTVSIEGARFPLNEFDLEFGVGVGVSNEMTSDTLAVTILRGLAVVVFES